MFSLFACFFILLSLWLFLHFSPKCLWPKMCFFVRWFSFELKQNKSFLRSYGFFMFNDKLSSLRHPLLKIINDVKFYFYRNKCIWPFTIIFFMNRKLIICKSVYKHHLHFKSAYYSFIWLSIYGFITCWNRCKLYFIVC